MKLSISKFDNCVLSDQMLSNCKSKIMYRLVLPYIECLLNCKVFFSQICQNMSHSNIWNKLTAEKMTYDGELEDLVSLILFSGISTPLWVL